MNGGCPGGTRIAIEVQNAGGAIDRRVTGDSSCGEDTSNDEIFSDLLSLVEPMTERVDLGRLTTPSN